MDDVRVLEGDLDASGARFCILVSRFNAFITERLLEGAVDALVRHGAKASDITVVRVPGAFELAATAAKALEGEHGFDGLVALGCLMRGDTIHFDLIAGEATKGLSGLSVSRGVAIGFGLLTTDTLEQAVHRAGAKHGNKGAEAAMAAVEQLTLFRTIERARTGP
ncbi:MAG: 6,7-dimethyl-8-ribityllumazine synthase [Deltaproteobacteria bacterium]|nr:6,7-dimethyl-8-ribityllumazine synthase [Deltaproteobacteria bacterium]